MRAAKTFLVVVLVVGLAAGLWALFSLYSEVKELRSIRQMPAAPAPAQQGQEYATIYLVKAEPTEFHLVPVQRKLGGPATPQAALQALINGPLAHEELFASVPASVQLRSLTIQDGLATADFSSEIVKDFNGGALLESYLVTAIVNTLTEFPQIQQVQILVEGEAVESIGGHILVSKPLSRAR
jgi:germination protein M